ncbi:ubiquinone biosynthesis protein COQ4 [Archangium lipolyticum]|uniref:ubiquinone biosynthesis protein COQ4 n=1 Tax=Archangium lipolyticum TaxID=2970465 RepID=UPI00214A34B9|nr:ubiquinone biosynthesis protein COQ4 [Archangium lipolyticum]
MIDPNTLSLPDNAPLFTRLRVALQCLQVLKQDPGNPICGPLLNTCLDLNVYESLAQQLQRSEEGRRLLSERPSLQGKALDLTALERLPEGSLGHEFARYFRDNKISPFETTFEIKNHIDFIGKRYRETHDLLHVLTGYATDVVGEMELQAYVLGNLGIHTAKLILLFGTFGQIKERQPGVGLSEYMRRLRAAYLRGRASSQFLGFWFEHHWETPVATLSARLCAPAERMN